MKKILALFLGVSILFSLPAFAGKEDKIKNLLKQMHYDRQIDTLIKQQILVPVECAFVFSDSEKEEVEKELKKVLNFEDLTEPMIRFMSDYYTDSELDDIVAFYETETGQKSLKFTEDFMPFYIETMQKWEAKNMPLIAEYMGTLEKKYSKRSGEQALRCMQKHQGMGK